MPGNRKEKEKLCLYCNGPLAPNMIHEEFDFFKHPDRKADLRELQNRLTLLGRPRRSTSFDWVNEYAVQRKLKSARGVVDKTYDRLCQAYKWLWKLEEQDDEIAKSQEESNLPF